VIGDEPASAEGARSEAASVSDRRDDWLSLLERLARPVLEASAERRLVASMPVEAHPDAIVRDEVTYLEAVGRLLSGIAPWLEASGAGSEPEEQLRDELRGLAQETVVSILDPGSPDRANFTRHFQPLVDAAFLALALLRAPTRLAGALDGVTHGRLVDALRSTRSIQPFFSNWLLFSALVEVALGELGADRDVTRVNYALRQCEQWYVGDGRYSDGPELHDDFYNSIVLHPFLLEIAERTPAIDLWLGKDHGATLRARARRHCQVLERSIGPDGSFPVVGRSLAYRAGLFHLPAHLALARDLPDSIQPAALRAALGAVIERTHAPPGTFDESGWLRIGLAGAQPSLGEGYISTGSLYLTASVLLPLGLDPDDEFWSAPALPWTGKRAWQGEDVPADKALPGRRRF
jgi:hypothetical protein